MLAQKENQPGLYEDVKLYFSDPEVEREIREKKNYLCTREKAHGQLEGREYYQTDDIKWLSQKKEWRGVKSIGMEKKTIEDEKGERKEYRYYISSLPLEIETFGMGVRGHWSIESMHWHLDVTFREDANTTLDKQEAQNQNSLRPIKYLEEVLFFKKGMDMETE